MDTHEHKIGGPGLDGYAYNAAVYCVECGHGIIDALAASGKLPAPNDILFSDSESCPQPIFFGESPDCSQHCDKCGVYLYGDALSL